MFITYPAWRISASIVSFGVSGATWSVHRVFAWSAWLFRSRSCSASFGFKHCRVTGVELKFLASAATDTLLLKQYPLPSSHEYLVHTRWLSLIGFFRWQSARPLPGGRVVLTNLSKPYFSNVFSSIWQALSEMFVHKNFSQNREISPSGPWNPHLQKGVGLLVICFSFQRYKFKRDLRPRKIHHWTLNYYNFILKSNLKIPWHPFQDKHLLSVMESLFTSQSQNPSRVFRVYECRSICASPSVDHFIFDFTSEKHFLLILGSISFKMMYRFRYFVNIARPWDQFCGTHPRTCSVTLKKMFCDLICVTFLGNYFHVVWLNQDSRNVRN